MLTPIKYLPTLEVGVGFMEKTCKTSAQLGKNTKGIRFLYEETIFIPHNPEPIEDDSPPDAGNFWRDFLINAVWVILVLLLFRSTVGGLFDGHAPDFDFVIKQIRHFGGQ